MIDTNVCFFIVLSLSAFPLQVHLKTELLPLMEMYIDEVFNITTQII